MLYNIVYDIVYDVVYDIYYGNNKSDISAHHLRQYEISQHEWQVVEKNFDPVPSHVHHDSLHTYRRNGLHSLA